MSQASGHDSASDVRLAAFDSSRHLSLLEVWLDRGHVSRWWGKPADSLAALGRLPADARAVIEVDGLPVGFVCWQRLPCRERVGAGLDDLPSDLVDIDILIGEPGSVGRGVGPDALRLVMNRLEAVGVRHAGIASSTSNERALRAFRKAGFRPFRTFRDAGQEMQYLVRTLGSGS